MKKYLIFLIGIVSLLGINTVKADTLTYSYVGEWVFPKQNYIDSSQQIFELYDSVLQYYQENYIEIYPYYVVELFYNGSSHIELTFIGYKSKVGINFNSNNRIITSYVDSSLGDYIESSDSIYISSSYINGIYNYPTESGVTGIYNMLNSNYVERFNYYANFELLNLSDNTLVVTEYDEDHPGFIVLPNEPFPQFQTLQQLNIISDPHNYNSNYVEIDLNKYSYVILSLKDYTPRENFISYTWVKGQLCPTTVYNYGMEEKKDYISGYQTQSCGYYHNDWTLAKSYVKSEDISHYAVYYLTGYDSSKPNLVKVDSSIYNITYITSENEDEPYVTIDGKKYPALSYSSLTDTAEKTEKYGVSDTWTCAKYDTNCVLNSSGIDINNLFSNPLEMLKSIWTTVVSIFAIITEFIVLLPPTMQGFLYIAFGVGIALGIIKIIL